MTEQNKCVIFIFLCLQIDSFVIRSNWISIQINSTQNEHTFNMYVQYTKNPIRY